MLRLASMYSCISLWWSRWLGVTLVTTAMLGLWCILMSWKLDSSHHGHVVGAHLGDMGSRAAPMLPPDAPAACGLVELGDKGWWWWSCRQSRSQPRSRKGRTGNSSTSLVTMVPAAMVLQRLLETAHEARGA